MTSSRNAGFTLIEVLIALVILAIALTALLQATSEDIRDNDYLTDKTVAMMIADTTIQEAQLGLKAYPYAPDTSDEVIETFHKSYRVKTQLIDTHDKFITRIEVTVQNAAGKETTLITAEGFLPWRPV